MSFVVGLKKKNMIIKKLQATIEMQRKELEELKLTVKRTKMEHSKRSTAQEVEDLKKIVEEMRSEVTQIKEMKLQEQNKPSPSRLFERNLSFNSDFFSRSPSFNDLFSRPLVGSPSYSNLFGSIVKDNEPRPCQGGTSNDSHEDLE